ncbi:unnamed protein product [Schistosoma rodhaini]|nr:unnamed protein product [Schistosoma rodhaini]
MVLKFHCTLVYVIGVTFRGLNKPPVVRLYTLQTTQGCCFPTTVTDIRPSYSSYEIITIFQIIYLDF